MHSILKSIVAVGAVACAALFQANAATFGADDSPEAGGDRDTTAIDAIAPLAFGATFNKPWGIDQFAHIGASRDEEKSVSNDTETREASLVGGSIEWDGNRLTFPFAFRELLIDRDDRLRANSVGVEWRRQFGQKNAINFATQYGDLEYDAANARTATAYFASLGWSGAYAGDWQPRVGGSFFLGEEAVSQSAWKYLGRRYYGITADGSFSPYKDHSPYISFKYQTSDYAEPDPLYFSARSEDYARVAAGWGWQLQPHWHLRAEADRTVNSSNLSLYDYDINRLFFSTRFGFH